MAQQFTFDINSAIQAGYTPEQIQQYLASQQKTGKQFLTSTPQATPQQSQTPAPKPNFIADALPTVGSIVGGIAGAAIPGLGETGLGEIGGAAAGSGLGETARELIEGKPLNAGDIAGQTAIGGVGGAIGKGVGAVAGKVLSKVSNTAPVLEDVATGLKQGTRQIRVKPSIYGAGQEQAINTTLDKYGINGTAQQQYSQLQPAMQTIEGKINQFIQDNPDAGASMQDIKDNFMTNLNSSLRSKDLTASQAKDEINGYLSDLLKASNANKPVITDEMKDTISQAASYKSQIQTYENQINYIQEHGSDASGRLSERNIPALQGLADNLNEKLNNLPDIPNTNSTGDNITLAQLRDMKKLVNQDYGPVNTKMLTGGSLTPRQKVISAAWDSLDSAVKNASPEVKGLLTDESNLYKAAPSLSSARSNPPTLRLAGTSVPANVTQTGRELAAGTANTAANILQKTPTAVPSLLSQSAGQGITRNLLPATPGGLNQNTQSGQNNPQNSGQTQGTQNNTTGNFDQSNTLPSSPQAAFAGNNSTISNTGSQVLPSNPNAAFQDTPPSDFMKGYTVNGAPIDPGTANMIWQIVNYRIDPTKMTSLKNNEREQLISLASQYDPSYTSSQFPVVQKTREDYTSGKSAQTIRSLNTAIGHLNTLAQAGQGLQNGSIPFLNSAKNAISQGTGQPQVTRFNTAANAVAGEMAQVFKNSGATDDEIQAWKAQLDPNMSPQQLQVAINQMISLMGSRLSALQSQYSANVGKPADFSFISPESQQILQGLGVDPNSLMQQ